MKNCIICKEANSKYKCPTCYESYCSTNCCKQHKETECEKPIQTTTTVKEPTAQFITSDTVNANKLDNLRYDKDLNNLLRNSHLRDLLKTVDSSDKPNVIIQKAMHEPLFVEFVDACLKVVEPKEPVYLPT